MKVFDSRTQRVSGNQGSNKVILDTQRHRLSKQIITGSVVLDSCCSGCLDRVGGTGYNIKEVVKIGMMKQIQNHELVSPFLSKVMLACTPRHAEISILLCDRQTELDMSGVKSVQQMKRWN